MVYSSAANEAAYSNEELTQRVKQLELIVLDMMTQFRYRDRPFVTGICVNNALHYRHPYPEDSQAHPSTLELPHYVFQPQINWRRNIINLHPDNHA